MIKHISIVHRPPGLSHEAFVAYWRDVHAPLVKTRLPGLRKYVGNLPVATPGGAPLPFDAIVELHFDDRAALDAAMASPSWLAEDRQASSRRIIDYTRHVVVIAEEHEVAL